MSYEIKKAISFCNLTTDKDPEQIKKNIIIELGGDPSSSRDIRNLNNRIAGRVSVLNAEEFKAICKACSCPAYVLAGMDS